jgi:hypothetical protein
VWVVGERLLTVRLGVVLHVSFRCGG